MLQAYRQHVEERAKLGIPRLPLDTQKVADLVGLLKNPTGWGRAPMSSSPRRNSPLWLRSRVSYLRCRST